MSLQIGSLASVTRSSDNSYHAKLTDRYRPHRSFGESKGCTAPYGRLAERDNYELSRRPHRASFPTRALARHAVADYIEVFYDRHRPHSTFGFRTLARSTKDAATTHQTATAAHLARESVYEIRNSP